MLTEKEYSLIKNEMSRHFILIPPECIIMRVKNVFEILDHFIEERDYGNNRGSEGRKEEAKEEESLEAGIEQETSGEDRGTQSSSDSI